MIGRGSGHPTGPAALGQGQGAVVALLVPCQSSSFATSSIYSVLCHKVFTEPGVGPYRAQTCTQPIVKDAGVSTPLLRQTRHNSSPLVCHTLWHVGGFPGVCQKAFVGCADVACMPCHTCLPRCHMCSALQSMVPHMCAMLSGMLLPLSFHI